MYTVIYQSGSFRAAIYTATIKQLGLEAVGRYDTFRQAEQAAIDFNRAALIAKTKEQEAAAAAVPAPEAAEDPAGYVPTPEELSRLFNHGRTGEEQAAPAPEAVKKP